MRNPKILMLFLKCSIVIPRWTKLKSAPVDVIALTGAPVGDFWFSSRQLSTCLKALTGTVTLGIAGGGMLTLSTQDAFYMQSAMRAPTEKKTEKPARAPAAKAA